MSDVGNLFIAGKSAGGGWIEFGPFAGVHVQALQVGGAVCGMAAGVPLYMHPVPSSSSSANSAAVEGECRKLGIEQAAEGLHAAVGVDKSGRLYCWGNDSSVGQLGAMGQRSESALNRVGMLEDVVTVAAGDAHCVAIRYDGSAYVWGENNSGQLGLGATSSKGRRIQLAGDTGLTNANPEMMPGVTHYQPLPRLVSALHRVRIASAACGSRFTLLVSELSEAGGGDVFSFGEGGCGQLGIGRVTKLDTPVRVKIEATFPSPALLDAAVSGGVHSASALEAHAEGMMRQVDTRVVAVAAGWAHATMITRSGHVFSMGFNAYGQCGLGDVSSRDKPAMVYEMVRAEGGEAEYEEEDGAVFGFAAHSTLQPLRAMRVACGKIHTACLAEDGRAVTFGASVNGRLGHSYDLGPANMAIRSVDGAEAAQAVPASPAQSTLDAPSDYEYGGGSGASADDGNGQYLQQGYSESVANTWPFPTGVGPLRKPEGVNVTLPFADFPHMLRNAGMSSARPPAPSPPSAGGKPPFRSVEANTWVLPTVRTQNHDRMRAQAQEWARARADAAERGPYEGVRDEKDLRMQSVDALATYPGKPIAPMGKPWLRTALHRSTDPPMPYPTAITHPALAGRPAVNLTCGTAETVLFVPAVLRAVVPSAGASEGGTSLTLSGPGLSSVCKVPEAAMHAALSVATSQADVARIVELYMPRADETGMVPIPGVFIRFSCRFDDLTSGSQQAALPDATAEIHACKAYYPRQYDFSGFDSAGSAGLHMSFNPDGTLGHVGGTASAGPESMDCILTIAPTVTRPCVTSLDVVVLDPSTPQRAVFTAKDEAVVRGSVRFDYFLQPTVTTMDPTLVAVGAHADGTIVRIAGEGLFGCALVDGAARPIAEELVNAVQELVRSRESAEAARLSLELAALSSGKPPPKEAAPVPPDHLHVSRTAGSVDTPCDAIISLDVLVNGVQAGRTPPVRGWYELLYKEHPLDVVAARKALAAAVRSGVVPGPGHTGLMPPTSSPKGAPRPGSAASLSHPNTPLGLGPRADDSGAEPEDPTVVGTYHAVVCFSLPDVSDLLGPDVMPHVPHAVADGYAALARAALGGQVDESALCEPAVLEAMRTYSHAAALSGMVASGVVPRVTLRPRLSFNGGHDWVDAEPTAALRALRPLLSHVDPVLLSLSHPSALCVHGVSLPTGTPCTLSVHPCCMDGNSILDSDGSQTLTVQGVVRDETSIDFLLPALSGLAQGASGPTPIGFLSFELVVRDTGGPVRAAAPLLVTAYAGGATATGPSLVALGVGVAHVQMSSPTLPQVDAVCTRAATGSDDLAVLASPIDGRASWSPPLASVGCSTSGRQDGMRVWVQAEGCTAMLEAGFTHNAHTGTLSVQVGEAGVGVGPVHILLAADGLKERAVLAEGTLNVFDPASLAITACTAKKIAPGCEIPLTVTGLDPVLGIGERQEVVAKAPPPTVTPAIHVPPSSIQVKLVAPGATGADPAFTGIVPAAFLPDYTGVSFVLPGASSIGDVDVALSLDAGLSWSTPFLLKVAKK